ncbi:MAG: NAD-dependent epimerase/dehydratase family protein [Planctomycetes bacterium]|jgi:nucleoside-diphosphate-sugar epimerase|nr:NAD-dependent epimerase/dehydratase family protein [Planctomycetota bacterium]
MTDDYRYYENKTVLVSGGAGAIGSNLTRTLAECGARSVIVLDNFSSSYKWNVPNLPNVMLVEGDVCDEVVLKRVFFEKPAVVFHLAAFFANQNSIDYPDRDLATNGQGTLKMLQYATLRGVDRFVYASSGCSIYGSGAPLPLKEDFLSMNLSTPYQITKMLGELYCNFFHHHYGTPVVKARLFNSYGPGEVPGQYRNVIPNFVYWALKGQPLPITGSGEETRDFTYVGDLVDGLLRAGCLKAAVGEQFNLASSVETRILDLATMINELTGNEAGIKFASRRKWDSKSRLWASVERAERVIGYRPKVAFREGLKTVIDWFRAKWNLIDASASFNPGMSSAVRDRATASAAAREAEPVVALVAGWNGAQERG